MKLTKMTFIKSSLIWGLCFSLNSCAFSQKVSGIDPEFREYLEDFNKIVPEYKTKLTDINIGFENFYNKKNESSVIARCYYNVLFKNTITIDKTYWKNASPTGKYFTMLHELGHCICYADHSEPTSGFLGKIEDILFKLGIRKRKGYLEDGCPASIMHPTDFSDMCALRHYYYYINELRKTCLERG